MKVRIGDYVRTKYGISRCIDIDSKFYTFSRTVNELFGERLSFIEPDEIDNIILKSNDVLIKVLEPGDLINGRTILNIYKETIELSGNYEIHYSEINEIITKEQRAIESFKP